MKPVVKLFKRLKMTRQLRRQLTHASLLAVVALSIVCANQACSVGGGSRAAAGNDSESSIAEPTATPAPVGTPGGTWTDSGGVTHTPTPTPVPTATPVGAKPTATPKATATPAPTAAPTAAPTLPPTTSAPVPGTITTAIMTSEEAVPSMSSMLGVAVPSGDAHGASKSSTYLNWDSSRAILSEDGSADSLTAPMLMAITNLGAHSCDDLIMQESGAAAASRRVFVQWDFTGKSAQSSSAISDTVRRLARSIYGRNETDDERQLITTAMAGFGAADSKAGAMLVCTAMISSLDAIKR